MNPEGNQFEMKENSEKFQIPIPMRNGRLSVPDTDIKPKSRTSLKYPEIIISKAQNPRFRWGSYYNGSSEQNSLFERDDQSTGKHICSDKCVSIDTPLHEAAKKGNPEMIDKLLENIEVNPNARDCLGKTALHYAVERDCNCDACIASATQCVNLLVKCPRSDINIQDNNGETPLHLAAENQATKAAEVLLYNGADVSIKSKSGVKAVKLMVEKIPDAMECLLTRAVTIEKYNASNAKCEVKMDFGAIVGYETKLGSRDSGNKVTPAIDAARQSYRKETQLLTLILESANRNCRKKLLTHPLIAIFLYRKWRAVRPWFWGMILFHSALLILYTLYILDVYVISCPYRPKITEPAHVKAAKAAGIKEGFITRENETLRAEYIQFSWFQFSPQLNLKQIEFGIIGSNQECFLEIGPTVKSILLLSLTTLMTFNELFKMLPAPWLYWKASNNQFQWAYFLLIYLTAWPVFMEPPPNISFWQYQAAAFGLFLAWSIMLFQIGKFPKLGLYVEILTQVLKNFGFFMITYASIVVAFALAFCVLFPGNAAYSSIPLAVLKVMMLMVGEVDYEKLFYGEEESPVDDLLYPITGHVLYGLFVVMITIVLMNLLVGLTVSDIQGLQKDAEIMRLSRQISEISQLEGFVFSKRLQSVFPGRVASFLRNSILVVPSSKYSAVSQDETNGEGSADSCCVTIYPNDPNDKSAPEYLKASILRVAESRHRIITRTNHCKNSTFRDSYAGDMSPLIHRSQRLIDHDQPNYDQHSTYSHLRLPIPKYKLIPPSSTHSLFVPQVDLDMEDLRFMGQQQLGRRNITSEDVSRERRHSTSSTGHQDYFTRRLEDKIMDRIKVQMDDLYKKIEDKLNELK